MNSCIHKKFYKGIQLALSDSDGIMWFKWYKKFFSLVEDLSNNEYISDKLTQNIATFQTLGKLL